MGARVSAIRPLERGDLEAVTDLYEAVFRVGLPRKPGLVAEFERTVLDHPWADPEIPSLVYEGPGGAITGFLASHVRRMRHDSNPMRMACSGQLVTDPAYARRGIGALLLRHYMGGPQDLTITDGATEAVRAIWEGLGGSASALSSLSWTRVFRPVALLAEKVERRRGGRPVRGAFAAARVADAVAGRRLAPAPVATVAEPLDPPTLLDAVAELSRTRSGSGRRGGPVYELRPDYDQPFLEWLFRETAAVQARGELVRHLLRDSSGALVGWYVFYNRPGGTSQVIQVGGAPASAGAVLDHLFRDAAERGCGAISGRVEAALLPALTARRCLFGRTDWALLHSDDPAPLNAIAYGRALLTRLDGEWWMGHHLGEESPRGSPAVAARKPGSSPNESPDDDR
jgi:hypothetical protein